MSAPQQHPRSHQPRQRILDAAERIDCRHPVVGGGRHQRALRGRQQGRG
jgi:hypothetical protein